MTSETVDRRMLLRGAGLVGATALGGTAIASSASADGRQGGDVTGAWLVQHRDDPGGDPTEVTGVVTFAEGGVITSRDLDPAGPPAFGAWKETGHHGFRGTFLTSFPDGEPPSADFVIAQISVRGRVRRDRIRGTYRFVVHLSTGDVMGTGTFEGDRIQA